MTKVHIAYNANKGDVISRIFGELSQGTGWKMSKHIDHSADIVYFPLYIQVGQSPNVVKQIKNSKIAAWFSHYEVQRKDKMQWWNTASSLVDIRTTTARQYYDILKPTGETHLVYPPPIDNQFRLPSRKPRIGVSGFVHPSGRKGEHLVKRLYEEMGDVWDIVATGKGWPVPDCKMREWHELPAFYKSLDVYLVTSITEGIPMPPLEALACGVPIVVPHYVGIFNQMVQVNNNGEYIEGGYPDGMWGYELDNYDEMLGTLRYVVSNTQPNTQGIVSNFTQEAWVNSHKEAFGMGAISVQKLGDAIEPAIEHETKEAIESVMQITPNSTMQKIDNAGAITIAYGKPARDCARRLIPSWQKHMSDYPIALVSDSSLQDLEDVMIYHDDTDIGARSVKTNLYNIAPQEWQYILYLDSDTEIIADVSQLFRWLASGFDMIFTTNPMRHSTIKDGLRPDNAGEYEETVQLLGSDELLQLQGGVIAFQRNERTEKFWNSWHEEWSIHKARDQYALLRALHKNPVKFLLLGNEWNTIIRSGVDLSIEDSAGILHHPMNARRWDGIIYGKLDSDGAWERVREWESENL